MLQITPQMNFFVAIEPVDFRKGIDGLSFICRQKINQNPFSGAVFLFRNKNKNTIKILAYDGQKKGSKKGQALVIGLFF